MRAIIIALLTSVAPAAAFEVEPVVTFEGICEPSGAVAVAEGGFGDFMVANDEDNVLRIFAAAGGAPRARRDISEDLGLDPGDGDDDIDMEAATWLDGTAYFAGSHGRSRTGKIREARAKLFTIQPGAAGITDDIPAPEHSYSDLLAGFASLGNELADAIGPDESVRSLAPEEDGFNLEGMTAAADGRSILFGLRNPVPAGKALLVRLQNPAAVVEAGASPGFGGVMELDLGGLGIRSIEYAPAISAHYIIGGPSGGSGAFALYRWTEGEDAATLIPEATDALADLDDFSPEAMVVDPTGKRVRLLSDDGDSCDEDAPTFRGVVLTLN